MDKTYFFVYFSDFAATVAIMRFHGALVACVIIAIIGVGTEAKRKRARSRATDADTTSLRRLKRLQVDVST